MFDKLGAVAAAEAARVATVGTDSTDTGDSRLAYTRATAAYDCFAQLPVLCSKATGGVEVGT